MRFIWGLVLAGLVYEVSVQGPETRLRGDVFAEARTYAHRMRKPC
jgi:hypothetical protein